MALTTQNSDIYDKFEKSDDGETCGYLNLMTSLYVYALFIWYYLGAKMLNHVKIDIESKTLPRPGIEPGTFRSSV